MSSADTLTHSNWAATDKPEFHAAYESALEVHLAEAGRRRDVPVAGSGSPATGKAIVDVSPGDNSLCLAEVVGFTDAEVAKTVAATAAGFPGWRRTPWEERVVTLRKLARLIEA